MGIQPHSNLLNGNLLKRNSDFQTLSHHSIKENYINVTDVKSCVIRTK